MRYVFISIKVVTEFTAISCQSFQIVTMVVQCIIIVHTAGRRISLGSAFVCLTVQAFAALRAYALSNRNRYVLTLVVVSGGLVPLLTKSVGILVPRSLHKIV